MRAPSLVSAAMLALNLTACATVHTGSERADLGPLNPKLTKKECDPELVDEVNELISRYSGTHLWEAFLQSLPSKNAEALRYLAATPMDIAEDSIDAAYYCSLLYNFFEDGAQVGAVLADDHKVVLSRARFGEDACAVAAMVLDARLRAGAGEKVKAQEVNRLFVTGDAFSQGYTVENYSYDPVFRGSYKTWTSDYATDFMLHCISEGAFFPEPWPAPAPVDYARNVLSKTPLTGDRAFARKSSMIEVNIDGVPVRVRLDFPEPTDLPLVMAFYHSGQEDMSGVNCIWTAFAGSQFSGPLSIEYGAAKDKVYSLQAIDVEAGLLVDTPLDEECHSLLIEDDFVPPVDKPETVDYAAKEPPVVGELERGLFRRGVYLLGKVGESIHGLLSPLFDEKPEEVPAEEDTGLE